MAILLIASAPHPKPSYWEAIFMKEISKQPWYMQPDAMSILDELSENLEEDTRKHIEDVLNKGYCVIRSSLPTECIQKGIKRYARFKRTASRLVAPSEADKYRRVVNLHCALPELAELFTKNEPALKVLDTLFQDKATLYTSLFFEIGSGQDMHRDTPYFWTNPGYRYFGMWVALEEANSDNGCLIVLEGSHLIEEEAREAIARSFYNDNAEIPASDMRLWSAYQEQVTQKGSKLELKCIEVHVNAGDTIIWHPQTMHGGLQIKDKSKSRMSQAMHITPPNVAVYHNNAFFNPQLQLPESTTWDYTSNNGRKYINHPVIDFEHKFPIAIDELHRHEQANLLAGVPLIHHPMFHGIWRFDTHSDELNRIATSLNRDGFVIIDFPEQRFDQVAEEIKQALTARLNTSFPGKSGLRIQDAWAFCEAVKLLAVNPEMLSILSTLYGRRAIPFQTLNFPVGTEQDLHSDHPHFYSIPERFMCGVWIALEDVDENNGALFYYPGSHNWLPVTNDHLKIDPDQDAKTNYAKYIDTWKMLAEAYSSSPVTLRLKKGQAVIWTSNVVHGGSPILDRSRTRWSQVTHYYFEDCTYMTPMSSNMAKGKIDYRVITDIATGKLVQNKSCEKQLPNLNATAEPVRRPAREAISTLAAKYNSSVYKQHPDIPMDFNPEQYYLNNQDVFESEIDPFHHYALYGKKEGRSY